MPEFEDSGFKGMWLPGRRLSGDHGLVVVAKRRFLVDLASADCEPAEETPDVLLVPEYTNEDDPATSSVDRAADAALDKRRVDVVVRGTAYAPGGQPAPEFEVGLRITGVLERRLRIVGPRVARWVAPKKLLGDKEKAKGEVQEYPPPEFTEPQPIEKLPLRYELAYGGTASIVLEEDDQEVAEEHQEEAKEKEARRKRKKEIEAELRAEEEAKAEEAEAAKAAEESGVADEEARAKADEAFREEGTRTLDAEVIRSLEEEEAEGEEMVAVSEYRLGRDLPDRPEEEEEEAGAEEEGAEETEEEEAEGGDPEEESPFSEGTKTLDVSDLEPEDELRQVLDEEERRRREALKDEEGTQVIRTEGMEDVTLADDEWIGEAGARPEEPEEEEPEESPYPQTPYPANPAGRGFCVSPLREAVDGTPLPCIEYPDRPLEPEDFVRDLEELELSELEAVPGFGPYPPGWFPRAALAGVMPWDEEAAEEAKKQALEEYDPEDPDDREAIEQIEAMETPIMQPGWYQEAHPDLQVERLRGDEEIHLENLTPDGQLFLRLPGRHPTASVDLGQGASHLFMRLDTLVLDLEDPSAPAVDLVWRGWYPLRDFEQLEEATKLDVRLSEVGQMDWMDRARAEALGAEEREEGTRTMAAMEEDGEGEEFVRGAEADRRYREALAAQEAGEEAGQTKEEGTAVLQEDREYRTSDDWEDPYREGRDVSDDEAREAAEEAERRKDAEIRKKAREKADEEFGIERDEEDEES
ncbi:MAG: DUF2169 domain-containing protein [Myxococcota bacterium]